MPGLDTAPELVMPTDYDESFSAQMVRRKLHALVDAFGSERVLDVLRPIADSPQPEAVDV